MDGTAGDEARPPGGTGPGPAARGSLPLPLHPMTLSDVLDGAFKLYRANAKAVVAVAAAFIVPLQLLAALVGRTLIASPLRDALDEALAGSDTMVRTDFVDAVTELVSGLAVVGALPFVTGGVSIVVARSYLGGRMDAGAALRVVGRRWWPLLASWALVHLLAVLGLLLCFLPGLLLLALYIAVPSAVVVEDRGPLAAMRRSSGLARGRVWRILGIGSVAWFIDLAISSALGWVLDVGSFLLPAEWVVRIAGSMAINVVTTPFVAIVAVLLYFDLRIRKEGFDLEVMAADVARRGELR